MGVFAKKGSRSGFAVDGGDRSPSQAMAYFVLCSATLFSLVYTWNIYSVAHQAHLTFVMIGLLTFKTLVEVSASYYGFAFLFIAVTYLFRREGANEFKPVQQPPPVGLIYLCCNDLARKIRDFRTRKASSMVQIRCSRGFDTKKEAFACPNIPRQSVCSSQIFLIGPLSRSLINGRAVPMAERFCCRLPSDG